MNDEATLTIKVQSTEEVPAGPPRGPAPATPSSQPISKAPVQPPAPKPSDLERMIPVPGGGHVPLSLFPPDVQAQMLEVMRAQEAAKAAAKSKPQAPHDDAWVLEQARRAMERDDEAKRIELARRAMSPEGIGGIGTRGDVLLRAEEKRRRQAAEAPIEGELVRDTGWALERAREQMQREDERRMIEQARRQADPAYARQKDEESAKRRAKEEDDKRRESVQRANFGAMALSAAGLPTLAKIPAGFAMGSEIGAALSKVLGPGIGGALGAAGGPIGAIVAGVQATFDKLGESFREVARLGSAIISFDPDRFARGMADLAGKVPLVGGLLGGLAHGILDMSDAVGHAAHRFAQYNSALAIQEAQFELVRIQRDMFRAQRFGPEIMAANEQRFRFEMRMQTLMERFLPMFLSVAEKLLTIAETIASGVENAPAFGEGFADAFLSVVGVPQQARGPQFWSGVADGLRVMLGLTRRIADNTDPAAGGEGDADPFQGLFRMEALRAVVEQAPPMNQRPGILNPAINFGA